MERTYVERLRDILEMIDVIGGMIEGYQRVADEVIWRTATRSLPELRPVIVAMVDGARGR